MGGLGLQTRCIGCGARVPDEEGPTHRYIGASPGCWAIYGGVLAREFGEFRDTAVHRLSVDAYAVQHPGTPSPQSIQSVAVHLIRLCLMLERDVYHEDAIVAMKKAANRRQPYEWLEPPASRGEITVLDVAGAKDLEDHRQRVTRWAESVWQAWAPHHEQVRVWADEFV